MKVKYPLTPELYKKHKRIKNRITKERIHCDETEKTFKLFQDHYEFMKVLEKIDGKLFVNSIPSFEQYNKDFYKGFLTNDKNELIKYDITNIDYKPYADGYLIYVENIEDYKIGEYYYIMELEND